MAGQADNPVARRKSYSERLAATKGKVSFNVGLLIMLQEFMLTL
jgi:hypothetical protein